MRKKTKLIYAYIKKKPKKKYKIEYDKTGKIRPAWVKVENPPKGATFIAFKFGKTGFRYLAYLGGGLYLPTNYTKEEMSKYYDKFSETYDRDINRAKQNHRAIKYIIKLLKDLKVKKSSKILDICAGTGIGAEHFIKNGYKNITLLDFSRKMIAKAKKKEQLKDCKFIVSDLLKFKTKNKYNVVTSFFGFGSSSYFTEKQVEKGLKNIKSILKKGGLLVIQGYPDIDLFSKYFKPVTIGTYVLNKKKRFYTTYFIGRK